MPQLLVVHDVIVEWDDETVLGQRPRLQPGPVARRAVGHAARHHVEHPHRLEYERLQNGDWLVV